MNDLTEFLTARLDEDEAAAKAWLPFGNPDAAARAHVARHDPGRVLAEVEAKRRLLDGLHPSLLDGESTLAIAWGNDPDHSGTLLKILAMPYADHPDYRDEWTIQ